MGKRRKQATEMDRAAPPESQEAGVSSGETTHWPPVTLGEDLQGKHTI